MFKHQKDWQKASQILAWWNLVFLWATCQTRQRLPSNAHPSYCMQFLNNLPNIKIHYLCWSLFFTTNPPMVLSSLHKQMASSSMDWYFTFNIQRYQVLFIISLKKMTVTGQTSSYFAWQRMVDAVKVFSFFFPIVIQISCSILLMIPF